MLAAIVRAPYLKDENCIGDVLSIEGDCYASPSGDSGCTGVDAGQECSSHHCGRCDRDSARSVACIVIRCLGSCQRRTCLKGPRVQGSRIRTIERAKPGERRADTDSPRTTVQHPAVLATAAVPRTANVDATPRSTGATAAYSRGRRHNY